MLIACGGCTGSSSLPFAATGFFGGWASLVFVFGVFKFKRRMTRLWGVPRFQISDFVSLTLLMMWPLLLASMNRDPSSSLVVTCTAAFMLCNGYLWIRSLWILQELRVNGFRQRTMFIVVLLPLAICFSLLIGHWVLMTLFLLSMGQLPWILVFSIGYGIFASILGVLARSGMTYVFGPPPPAQPRIVRQSEYTSPEHWIAETNPAAT